MATGGAADLISFVAQMSGEGSLRVEEDLGEGFVRLRVAEAERRQAKHDIRHVEDVVIELLRNARDAGAAHVFVATARTGTERTLAVIDDGSGIPDDMRERVFEARVTSKLESMRMDRWGVHGRGMALYSIRQNAEDARVLASGAGLGASLWVRTDAEKVAERADQSSWPEVERQEDGSWACVRGPHNIARTCCEFALAESPGIDVYLGTPTEVAATLYAFALDRVDRSKILFVDDETTYPVAERLGFSADAADFIRIAAHVGVPVSERTAHRILAGQIEPLRPVASRITRRRRPAAPKPLDLSRDRRGLKIGRDDLEEFSRGLERAFSPLEEKYYVRLAGSPLVRVGPDRVTVTFKVDKED